MPTAEATLEWEIYSAEPEELTTPADQVVSWRDTLSKSSTDAAAMGRQQLEEEIERSRLILALEDNWDGEGSTAYAEDTIERATSFLTRHVDWVWRWCGVEAPIPKIGPGPDGSIDLFWKQSSWELLVNIPANPDQMATFYGDNYGAQKIKGSFDPKKVTFGIATWLMM